MSTRISLPPTKSDLSYKSTTIISTKDTLLTLKLAAMREGITMGQYLSNLLASAAREIEKQEGWDS